MNDRVATCDQVVCAVAVAQVSLDPLEIANLVDRVLTDPGFTESIESMRETYVAYRKADRSTERIEKYLATASRQVSGRPGETR